MLLNLTDDELRALKGAAGKGSASDYARDVLLSTGRGAGSSPLRNMAGE